MYAELLRRIPAAVDPRQKALQSFADRSCSVIGFSHLEVETLDQIHHELSMGIIKQFKPVRQLLRPAADLIKIYIKPCKLIACFHAEDFKATFGDPVRVD